MIIFTVILILFSAVVVAENKTFDEPLYIESDVLEVDQTQNVAIFKGKVKAKQKDMELCADVMKVFYSKEKGAKTNEATIERIEAWGNVIITQGERKAFGEKAIFYHKKEEIVLKDNARVVEGKNCIEGDEIVFLLKENKTLVKGQKRPVQAIIYPRKKHESHIEGRKVN